MLLLGGGGDSGSGNDTSADAITVEGMPIGLNVHVVPDTADDEQPESYVTVATREGNLVTFSAMSREQEGDTIQLDGPGEGVHTGGSFAWVTLPKDDAVAKVPLDGTGRPLQSGMTTVPVGDNPTGIAGFDGSIFVANTDDGTISQITPSVSDDAVPIDLPPDSQPADMAFDEDSGTMWVSDRTGRVIERPARWRQARGSSRPGTTATRRASQSSTGPSGLR